MARTRFIPPKRRDDAAPQGRHCTACGAAYHRRNLTEVWDVRNAGHRTGWHKAIARLCMACMSADKARRVLFLAHVTPATAPATDAEKKKAS